MCKPDLMDKSAKDTHSHTPYLLLRLKDTHSHTLSPISHTVFIVSAIILQAHHTPQRDEILITGVDVMYK